MTKPDLDSKEHIRQFVTAFYAELLKDPLLAPVFLDVADIDLSEHLPLICSYWEKLLLAKPGYNRHTMNIHRALHAKRPLTAVDFNRWLSLFAATLERLFEGPNADRARQVATQIAENMHRSVSQ